MPLYDYQCDECGHIFEVKRKRTDPEPETCPKCGKPNPRRAISATSFQLKGSGWYVTDYKGVNPSTSPSSTSSSSSDDGDASSSSSSSSESSSDSSDPAPASGEVA